MEEFIGKLPDWAGTVPQWLIVASLVIALVRLFPVVRQQNISANESTIKLLVSRLDVLRNDLNACNEKCDKETAELKAKIQQLEDERLGDRRQQLQEQISLVNSIISSVDAPELKNFLKAMESVQSGLRRVRVIRSEEQSSDTEGT